MDEDDDDDDDDDPNREFEDIPTHAVQILLEEDEGDCDGDVEAGSSASTCATRMRVVGKMAVCAFVPAASTVGHATDCVRTDVARSLWGRDAVQCSREIWLFPEIAAVMVYPVMAVINL